MKKSALVKKKPYVTIQFWGNGPDAPKNVASARSELERLLEGIVILLDG